jgi:hypothetical protein
MNVAAQERPKTSVRIRKNFSGSGHRRLREGDSGSLEGRIRRDAVGAKDSLSADPLKRAGRAKLVRGENGPSGSNLVILMRHSDQVLRTVLELSNRRDRILAADLAELRQGLIDAVAEIDSLALH